MTKILSDACIRAGWEAERENIRCDLLSGNLSHVLKFNPRSVEKVIDNFFESMVFAKLPCRTMYGIIGAAKEYRKETTRVM